MSDNEWHIFRNDNSVRPDQQFPDPPPWRRFYEGDDGERKRAKFIFAPHEVDLVNAALYLRRPLLITGKPGVGKSSLIYSVARELNLGKVLVWPINTRSTLEQGLYRYDAIGRLHELEAARARRERNETQQGDDEGPDSVGKYITLGPLGTAFVPAERPRALLIDEIDKSDIDLPNDLLNIFEDGWFDIPVLVRVKEKWRQVDVLPDDRGPKVTITEGVVRVREFPFVVMTSNGERDFPQPFLRRCIRMHIDEPNVAKLEQIVSEHLDEEAKRAAAQTIEDFHVRAQKGSMANDQLLDAVFLNTQYSVHLGSGKQSLYELLLRDLKS